MPWTIEILDMWHALRSSTWGAWEHWWWHWGPTLRRLSIILLGRNLPPGFTSIRDSLPPLPPLPPIPKTILIHFRAGQKFCFTTGSPKCRENEKSLERSKLWALDGEALVMDWRRLQLTSVLLVRGATAHRAMCNSCVPVTAPTCNDTWTVSWQTFDIFCSFLQSIRYQVLGFVVCEIHI